MPGVFHDALPISMMPPGLLLLRHHLIFDLVVGRLRDDLLLHQFVLPLVGTTFDDLLGVGVADAR